MKKKLEAELISIAHRILKLKNKSELVQLHLETQKLYEKLSVLRFVEENFGDVKPTIGLAEIEEKLTSIESLQTTVTPADSVADEHSTNAAATMPEIVIPVSKETQPDENHSPTVENKTPAAETENELVEEVSEETAQEDADSSPAEGNEQDAAKEMAASEIEIESPQLKVTDTSFFKPAFELSFDAKSEEAPSEFKEDAKDEFKSANTQITFEDILGSSYVDPVFVKPEDLKKEYDARQSDNVIPIGRSFSDNAPVISINKADPDFRSVSLNERLSKGITIGLNDRVAFMKHLFANSSEDYNRVLSQLITFDTFAEAQSFIDNMVKPDYNNWDGKDDYAERFMEIVEKKFS
ncbi:MAG: hypothetical protein H7199_03400 [Burkholderiales bacterium]|nr:hypothetical protein [Flavobacterium sp.]